MRIRKFEGKDLRQVLNLISTSMPRDQMSSEMFRHKILLQDNFDRDLCLVTEDQSKIIGFIFAPARGDIGYINIICVDQEHRRRGIGTSMLSEIQLRHRERGLRRIIVSGGPRYIVPGVDVNAYPYALDFFVKNGFKEVGRDSVSMSRSLMDYETPQHVLELEKRLMAQGFEFRCLDDEHVLDLILFLKEEFQGWVEEARGTLERYPNHLDWFTIALKDGEVVGYCQVGTDGLIEHFGPIGVAQEFRNKGIGSVLFHRCLRMIQAKGAKNVWFAWGGGRNYSFYSRNGMIETRRFAILSKDI